MDLYAVLLSVKTTGGFLQLDVSPAQVVARPITCQDSTDTPKSTKEEVVYVASIINSQIVEGTVQSPHESLVRTTMTIALHYFGLVMADVLFFLSCSFTFGRSSLCASPQKASGQYFNTSLCNRF
jgi:hypothetical protein